MGKKELRLEFHDSMEKPKNLKFEESLKRLEKIVEKLEAGDVSLEDSLSLYEEGVALFRYCSSKLEEAKRKVEILVKKGEKIEPVPFSEEPSEENGDENDS